MSEFNWRCPFCNRDQTVVATKNQWHLEGIGHESNAHGPLLLISHCITCANGNCKEITLTVYVQKGARYVMGKSGFGEVSVAEALSSYPSLLRLALRPESSARPLPDYIPDHIRKDYAEACRIIGLSANAAATMSRRCLQNMIRDFCEITRATLNLEINELKKLRDEGRLPHHVQEDTIEPIDDLRGIGNFGAHMDREANVLLDVTEEEAKHLISILELLFDEWYVARETRQARLKAISAAHQSKKATKQQGKEGASQSNP